MGTPLRGRVPKTPRSVAKCGVQRLSIPLVSEAKPPMSWLDTLRRLSIPLWEEVQRHHPDLTMPPECACLPREALLAMKAEGLLNARGLELVESLPHPMAS
jgi:hypothetical protein